LPEAPAVALNTLIAHASSPQSPQGGVSIAYELPAAKGRHWSYEHDALGADLIPDPTTAGAFCRRVGEADVAVLMERINAVRPGCGRAGAVTCSAPSPTSTSTDPMPRPAGSASRAWTAPARGSGDTPR
jgi:hypothetical protein